MITPHPLSNLEIIYNLKNIPNFKGVFMHDTLPNSIPKNSSGVFNLDVQANKGTHWVAWYKDKYFDSYGLPPPDKFLMRVNYPKIKSNDIQLQTFNEVICGHLCIDFIKSMNKNNIKFNEWIMTIYRNI